MYKSMFPICILAFVFILYADATCPPDTYPGANSTWCYKLYETPMTFENAKTVCLNLNNSGNLACIHNAFENSLIRSLISSNKTNLWWLGGYAYVHKDMWDWVGWEWVDGSSFAYNNFYKADNTPSESDVLEINAATGYWNAVDLNNVGLDYALPFVCQLKPTQ